MCAWVWTSFGNHPTPNTQTVQTVWVSGFWAFGNFSNHPVSSRDKRTLKRNYKNVFSRDKLFSHKRKANILTKKLLPPLPSPAPPSPLIFPSHQDLVVSPVGNKKLAILKKQTESSKICKRQVISPFSRHSPYHFILILFSCTFFHHVRRIYIVNLFESNHITNRHVFHGIDSVYCIQITTLGFTDLTYSFAMYSFQ
jgi:hypothetical protein